MKLKANGKSTGEDGSIILDTELKDSELTQTRLRPDGKLEKHHDIAFGKVAMTFGGRRVTGTNCTLRFVTEEE